MFEKLAEVLLIDATYKLNELRLPLFVLMSVDDNGEGEIMSWSYYYAEVLGISLLDIKN
jgi:hypothetical protein